MFIKRVLIFFVIPLLFLACSSNEEPPKDHPRSSRHKISPKNLPKKIKVLFVTQPHCPSCEVLEATMNKPKPHQLMEKYFKVEKLFLGKKLPDGLIPPNGTPTVYFLGYQDEPLIEPMIGEKTQEDLMDFLEDALYEFKHLYGVDLQQNKGETNETNTTDDLNTTHSTHKHTHTAS